jgi:hypothetical protein
VTLVFRGLPEPQALPVRRDQQGRKALWGEPGQLDRQARLDLKVLKAPRVTLVLKDLPGQRDLLARRDLPDPWVQLA